MFDHILCVRFAAEREDLDEVVHGLLFANDASGTTSETNHEQQVVRAYFGEPEQRSVARMALETIEGVTLEEISEERRDWLRDYQQSLRALEVGERFVVAPDFALIDDSLRIPIMIPQEQAFGTGSHETTALCLELLESAPVAGERCSDAGCGSGILAIAMAKLGAAKVVAFDNDVETFGVVALNMRRNEVPPDAIVQFFGSTDGLRDAKCRVMVMNILPDVIIAIAADAVRNLAPGGELIVSGVVQPARDEVVGALQATGLSLIEERTRGEWWAGRLRKP